MKARLFLSGLALLGLAMSGLILVVLAVLALFQRRMGRSR